MKKLIVNADDFGFTPGVNQGIVTAHTDGVVTATSVMTRGKTAGEAKTCSEQHPKLSFGLHFQIYKKSLEREVRDGKTVSDETAGLIRKEFMDQIKEFVDLIGHLPAHIDSHHHIHKHSAVWSIVQSYAKENGIPLREEGINFNQQFFGWDEAGAKDVERISVPALLQIIEALPEGTTELMCHPGMVDEQLKKISSYVEEREAEVKTLTDPEIKDCLTAADVQLCNWTV